MELFGYSLLEYMRLHSANQLRISLQTIRIICIQLFSALSFIHGIGQTIHCDLKPENVLIDHSGAHTKINKRISSFNILIQTLCYRSPEVLFGNSKHISSLMDIWSIGCVLFELFTVNGSKCKRLFSVNYNSKRKKAELICNISRGLSPFPIYFFNIFDSFHFIQKDPRIIYHKQTSYDTLKMMTKCRLMQKLIKNGIVYKKYSQLQELTEFVDLLACLLDVNPMTRYTSEDAMRHTFIIRDFCKNNANNISSSKHIPPFVKSTNDMQRQARIDQSFAKYQNKIINLSQEKAINDETVMFPSDAITTQHLY